MTQSNDIYDRITHAIIKDLEKGELTWRKPWSDKNLASHVMRPLRSNGVPYSGINTVMLWSAAAEKGYTSPYWMTFTQAAEMEAKVRSGEISSPVIFVTKSEKEEKNDDGTTAMKEVSFIKMYRVFNAHQIDGLPERFYGLPEAGVVNQEQRIEDMEHFFAQTKADIYTGRKACYYTKKDRIEMPPFESFNNAAGYYGVLAHEVTHWTSHPNRLNRAFNNMRFGQEGYAKEELVAELAACFLGADLGFEPITKENHSAYIQSWLKVLKNDNHFIIQAASQAQKAVEYLTNLQPAKAILKPAMQPM